MTLRIKGILRLVASVILCVFVLPIVLRLFLSLSPGASAQDYLLAFLEAAPFGDTIYSLAASILEEAQSGAEGVLELLELLELPRKSFALKFSMDMAETVFTSVILLLITNILGKEFFKVRGKDIFNRSANVFFQVFLLFCASLIVEAIFDFFSTMLMKIPEATQMILGYVYSASLGVVSVIILIIAGMLLIDAIIHVLSGCLSIFVSYTMYCAVLINQAGSGPQTLTVFVCAVWLILLWIILSLENLITGQYK